MVLLERVSEALKHYSVANHLLFSAGESSYDWSFSRPDRSLVVIPPIATPAAVDDCGKGSCWEGPIPCMFQPCAASPILVIHFHGNGGDVEKSSLWWGIRPGGHTGDKKATSAASYPDFKGVNVLAVEFPGYGVFLPGRCSEQALLKVARRVMRFVLEEAKVDPRYVVISGRSMGSGPATYLASQFYSSPVEQQERERELGGLVLISPYTSVVDVLTKKSLKCHGGGSAAVALQVNTAGEKGTHHETTDVNSRKAEEKTSSLRSRIVEQLLADRFPNKHRIEKVQCPTLLIHGALDPLIHHSHSEHLLYLRNQRKGETVLLEEGLLSHRGHNESGDVHALDEEAVAATAGRLEMDPKGVHTTIAYTEALYTFVSSLQRRLLRTVGPVATVRTWNLPEKCFDIDHWRKSHHFALSPNDHHFHATRLGRVLNPLVTVASALATATTVSRFLRGGRVAQSGHFSGTRLLSSVVLILSIIGWHIPSHRILRKRFKMSPKALFALLKLGLGIAAPTFAYGTKRAPLWECIMTLIVVHFATR